MNTRTRSLALVSVLLAAVAALVVGLVSPASASSARFCGITWGSLAKSGGTSTAQGQVTGLRAGRHACYDRLVVDLGAPATTGQHWSVQYRSVISADGSGAPVSLAGGGDIEIVLTPAVAHAGSRPTAPRTVAVAGFTTFREVRLISDFEGHVQIGLGVRARLPMRAFVVAGAPGSGDTARLVVDVAHRWTA